MITQISVTIVLVGTLQQGLGQGGKDIKPIPRALLEASDRCNVEISRARTLIENGRYDEAILAAQRAVRIEDDIALRFGWNSSSADYIHARALTLANRPGEALGAYRKAFWWSDKRQDLESNGPPFLEMGPDFGILLAKAGQYEEAKAMYYWVLRVWGLSGGGGNEHFPFLVVFDPDSTHEAWKGSPDKLLSALLMLRAIHTQGMDEQNRRLEEVRKREPAWVVPFVYLHRRDMDFRWITQAQAMAATSDEKQWMLSFDRVLTAERGMEHSVMREIRIEFEKMTCDRRKNSAVLKQAKLDMAKMHPKLATPPPARSGH